MKSDEAQPRSARDRLLDTAGILFYRDGFHAVGIDTIIAESGVAKMTLYRHFPSKEDLIVAYLKRGNALFWNWIDQTISSVNGPREQIIAIFEAIGRQAISPQCLGCPFQGAALEFPLREHPAHHVALEHKEIFKERLRSLAEQAGLRAPGELANQLLMLMEGAWIVSRMYGPQNPAVDLLPAVKALIGAQA